MICECGMEVSPRGRATHENGGFHTVTVGRRKLEATGLVPVSRRYLPWFDAAEIPVVEGPLNFHQGGIGRASTTTYALYVSRSLAAVVVQPDIPAPLRKRLIVRLGRVAASTRESIVASMEAAVRLGARPVVAAQLIEEGTPP